MAVQSCARESFMAMKCALKQKEGYPKGSPPSVSVIVCELGNDLHCLDLHCLLLFSLSSD